MLIFKSLKQSGQLTKISLVFGMLFTMILAVLVTAPANATNTVTGSGPEAGGTSVTLDGIRFVQISSRSGHALGLTSEGTVYAWGDNDDGQLGDGTNNSATTPVQVVGVGGAGFLSGITQVDAGGWHSLARAEDGTVYTWGHNLQGELGNGTQVNTNFPVQVVGVGGTGVLSDIVELNSGAFHTLARSSDGSVYSWGWNGHGQLGNGLQDMSHLPSTPIQVLDATGNNPLSGITQIAAGYHNSIALTNTGTVLTWGYNMSGELGNGTNTDAALPVQVVGVGGSGTLTGVTQIAAGWYFSLARTNSGHMYAWGSNNHGELGNGATGNGTPGTAADTNAPVQVIGVGGAGVLSGVTHISAGDGHSVAVTANGIYTWGRNTYGQLGDGTTTHSVSPVQVVGVGGSGVLSGISQIITGETHNIVLGADGAVYTWGRNNRGQLGNGTNTNSSVPLLGPNFQFSAVNFGTSLATLDSTSGNTWTVLSPAGIGTVDIIGTANLFGGAVPATPASVSWNAGTFTYIPANSGGGSSNGGSGNSSAGNNDGSGSFSSGMLTKTGASSAVPLSIAVAALLGTGIALSAIRRKKLMP